MMKGISEGPWFRWVLVFAFLATIFSLPLLPSPVPQQQTYQQPDYSPEKVEAPVSPDERLADYTEALAVFTALLAVVSCFQVWLLIRADAASKRIFELSEKQFLMEGRQADLAEKQHGLMRLQHIAANKPRLSIRGICLALPYEGAHSYFVEGYPIKGSLVVANNGATDAKIIDSGYRFYWSKAGIPMRPPIDAPDVSELLLTDAPIVGYGSRAEPIQSKAVLDATYTFKDNVAGGTLLYLMGYIHYADINGAERFMGFCRKYSRTDAFGREGRFVAIENPDYEYTD